MYELMSSSNSLSSAIHTGSVFLRGSAVAERKTFDAAFALSCCARAE